MIEKSNPKPLIGCMPTAQKEMI